MRVTSELWAAALLRRVFGEGGFGAVARRGAAEAGAVFVIVRGRDGGARLFGPAPQSDYGEARPDERRLAALPADTEEAIEAKLKREERFDPDIWVIEIEPGRTPAEELLGIGRDP